LFYLKNGDRTTGIFLIDVMFLLDLFMDVQTLRPVELNALETRKVVEIGIRNIMS
jgi:hypothetical protein